MLYLFTSKLKAILLEAHLERPVGPYQYYDSRLSKTSAGVILRHQLTSRSACVRCHDSTCTVTRGTRLNKSLWRDDYRCQEGNSTSVCTLTPKKNKTKTTHNNELFWKTRRWLLRRGDTPTKLLGHEFDQAESPSGKRQGWKPLRIPAVAGRGRSANSKGVDKRLWKWKMHWHCLHSWRPRAVLS